MILKINMKIVKCLGATKEEVESGKFDIWVGISLGNKYFTKENVKKYILWALENTKEDVLVLIGDRLYAIKLEALDKYREQRALKVASRLGDKIEKDVKEIISELPLEKRALVKTARFSEIIKTKYYNYRLDLLLDYYQKNKEFREFIANIVKSVYRKGPHTLNEERIDKLAEYVLREIPVYLNGAYASDKEKYYRCTIYPGLGLIDDLIIGIYEKKLFFGLAEKLKIRNQICILEG